MDDIFNADGTINRDKWLEFVVRPTRNDRLSKSDWTQLSDAPLTAEQKAAWATYRQILRDLPGNAEHASFSWPVEP